MKVGDRDLDGTAKMGRLAFRPVDRSNWPDMVRLFEERGGPKHCWCSVWRPLTSVDRRQGGPKKKAAMRRRVKAGIPVGILGYSGDRPVAWCSIAPRETYRPLGGSESPAESVWCVVCFFVPRSLRGRGITRRLLAAAEGYARRNGATLIEAYPVDADSPSYRFMGFRKLFAAAGYREVGRAGRRRHVVQKRLRPLATGSRKLRQAAK
jgi:GNAT superfamily N-acetyltransferase